MIAGSAAASIRRTAFWVRNSVPRRLTFITASKLSGSRSKGSPRSGAPMPAFATRQSSRPNLSLDPVQRGLMGGEIGDVEGLEGGLSAMAGDRRTGRLGLLVPLEVGQHQIIAGGGEGFGDGAADTALGPGDEGDGPAHARRSWRRICSALRSACAAMVRAGLTAAELGRKPASTTKRLGWSQARQ